MPVPIGVNGDAADTLLVKLNGNVKVAAMGGSAFGVAAENPRAIYCRMLGGPALNDLRVVSNGFHKPNAVVNG